MINIFDILLKKWHTENITDFHYRRQCKSTGYWSNPFKNLERSKKLRCQLGIWSNPQGSLIGLDAQVHPFPNLKLKQLIMIFITLLSIFCFLHILLYYLHFLFHLCQHVRSNQYCLHWIIPTDGIITILPIKCLKQTHSQRLLIPML